MDGGGELLGDRRAWSGYSAVCVCQESHKARRDKPKIIQSRCRPRHAGGDGARPRAVIQRSRHPARRRRAPLSRRTPCCAPWWRSSAQRAGPRLPRARARARASRAASGAAWPGPDRQRAGAPAPARTTKGPLAGIPAPCLHAHCSSRRDPSLALEGADAAARRCRHDVTCACPRGGRPGRRAPRRRPQLRALADPRSPALAPAAAPRRWHNQLNPCVNKTPFTEWEQAVIMTVRGPTDAALAAAARAPAAPLLAPGRARRRRRVAMPGPESTVQRLHRAWPS